MKSIYFTVIITVFLVISCDTKNDKTESTTNYWDENVSACQQLDQVDLKMLNMLKEIKKVYKNDKPFIKALENAQIYWIQYRNRQVKAIFPLSP